MRLVNGHFLLGSSRLSQRVYRYKKTEREMQGNQGLFHKQNLGLKISLENAFPFLLIKTTNTLNLLSILLTIGVTGR